MCDHCETDLIFLLYLFTSQRTKSPSRIQSYKMQQVQTTLKQHACQVIPKGIYSILKHINPITLIALVFCFIFKVFSFSLVVEQIRWFSKRHSYNIGVEGSNPGCEQI